MFIATATEEMNSHKMVSVMLKPVSYQDELIYITDMLMLH